MAKVIVKAGICKFGAVIEAEQNDDYMVEVDFKTSCPNFQSLVGKHEFDPMVCCFEKIGGGEIFDMFKPLCPHNTCPIPTAMLKAVEAAADLALPCDVTMTIEK